MNTTYRAEFAGVAENTWSSNALTFESIDEATLYAHDLMARWFVPDMARVVPTDTPKREGIRLDDPTIIINYRR